MTGKQEAKTDTIDRRSFTPEEQGIFIKNVMDNASDEIKLFVKLMEATGARNSEVTGLELNDVRLDAEIPNVKYRDNGTRLLGKNGLERSVPLSDDLVEYIRKYMETTELEQHLFPEWSRMADHKQGSLSTKLKAYIENKRPHDRDWETNVVLIQ